jgi:hypothetical protein
LFLFVGAPFTFFNTLQSHPAVVLFVYLYAKSTIPNAQHDSGERVLICTKRRRTFGERRMLFQNFTLVTTKLRQ